MLIGSNFTIVGNPGNSQGLGPASDRLVLQDRMFSCAKQAAPPVREAAAVTAIASVVVFRFERESIRPAAGVSLRREITSTRT